MTTSPGSWLTWDRAAEHEESFGPSPANCAIQQWTLSLTAPAATDIEHVQGGQLIRQRQELSAAVTIGVKPDGALVGASRRTTNIGPKGKIKNSAIARSQWRRRDDVPGGRYD